MEKAAHYIPLSEKTKENVIFVKQDMLLNRMFQNLTVCNFKQPSFLICPNKIGLHFYLSNQVKLGIS
jgi:hypothetical protein